MKRLSWKWKALEKVILLGGEPLWTLGCGAEKNGSFPGLWAVVLQPLPGPPGPLASPRAVGALADEQRLSRTANGAVGQVPVLVVQEEALQELVLGEGKARLPPLFQGLHKAAPWLPAYLARSAHPSLKQRVLRVHPETSAADTHV